MILERFQTPNELESAYQQAYEARVSRYETASHVLANDLGMDVDKLRAVLAENAVEPIGRDKTCWGKIQDVRSGYMTRVHGARIAREQLGLDSQEGACTKLCACGCLTPLVDQSGNVLFTRGHVSRDTETDYNLRRGAAITAAKLASGYSHSEETKQLLREINLNRSPETRAKILEGVARAIAEGRHGIFCQGKPTKPELMIFSGLNSPYEHVGQKAPSSYGSRVSLDIVLQSVKLGILADGCYWHGCPTHFSDIQDDYAELHAKDARQVKRAEADGWTILRFWEHEIYEDLDAVIQKIQSTTQDLLKEPRHVTAC